MKLLKKLWSFGPLLIVIAAALWALDGITRRSLYHLPPVTIVFYEHLIGLIILSPFIYQIMKSQKLTKKVWLVSAVIGLIGGLLGTVFITTALASVNFIAFSVVYLIQKLQPLFTITSAYFFLGEKLDRRYAKWAVFALLAAFFVTFPNGYMNLATGAGTIIAALYSLGAAAAWGTGTTFSKMLLNQVSDQASIVLRYLTATLWSGLAVVLMGQIGSLWVVGPSDIGRLVFIAFTTGLAAMFLYYHGLKTTEAKVSTILELTFPLLAVFVDMFLYKTFLAPTQYLAAAVLLFAMYRVGKLQNSVKVTYLKHK